MQREELERIYDEHAACAAALFRRFVYSEADVHDLLQDWLVKIARGMESMDGIARERAYLLRIAYRLAVDWTRRVGTRKRLQESIQSRDGRFEFTKEANPDREVLRLSLEDSLAELPQDQQLVVHLKLWDQLTFAEIGEVLSISPNTASSRYRYGLQKLQESLLPIYRELCT